MAVKDFAGQRADDIIILNLSAFKFNLINIAAVTLAVFVLAFIISDCRSGHLAVLDCD